MPTTLLQTKLHRPRVRRSLVSRPRLLGRINEMRALTLICAPAGFGKTTLLAEWVAQAPQPIAWLSLDEEESDPPHFWAYLIGALQTIAPDIGRDALAMLEQPSTGAALVTALLNDAAALPEPATLVIDDYHCITAAPIHAGLSYLLDHLPDKLRVVISSRSEPPDIPLARMRARGQLTELHADDLRLTPAEAAQFLRQELGHELPDEQIATLESRTEGWVAGLQLAALALEGGQDPSSLIAAFTGAHRDLASYLFAEVYRHQPPEVQSFLAQTALLDRLSGPLCDAVTGRADGHAMLDRLARANLFLSPLDPHGTWYRYHQLFREFLLQRCAQPQALHRRAADWLMRHGDHQSAVSHMLQSGDSAASAQMIASLALTVMKRADFATLWRWLAQLPPPAIMAHPRLCLAQVWMLLDVNQPERAASYLEQASKLLARARQPKLLAEALTLRAVVEAMASRSDRALSLAQRAQQLVVDDDPFTRGLIAYGLGAAYKMGSDGLRAEQCLREAGMAALAAGSTYLAIEAFGNLGDLQLDLGRLPEAEQSLLRTLEHTRMPSGLERPASGWIYWDLGRIHYEWNDLDAAQAEAEKAARLCAEWGNPAMQVRAHLLQAQIWQARHRWLAAESSLDQADLIAQQSSQPALRQTVLRRRFALALAQHDLPLAQHLAERLQIAPNGPIPYYQSFVLARLALAQGQPARALEYLRLTWQSLEQTNLGTGRVQALCLEALARRAMGQREQALQPLERALTLAAPGRFIRSFIEHGAPMHELLRRAALSTQVPDYVQTLLSTVSTADAVLAPDHPLVRLTERERQIMRLLATGLSNRDMAEQLVISEGTLKRHISNLYLKLAVSSRTQAVAKARDLHLI